MKLVLEIARTHLVSKPKRTALMPGLPTTEEAGYPGSAYNFWVGTLVAANTPRLAMQANQAISANSSPSVRPFSR